MMRRIGLFVLALLLALPAHAETIVERLDRFRAETRTPGVAVAVLEPGSETPRLFVSGQSNVELETAMVPDSMMAIGSVTKTFTAVLVLRLVERGLIGLDGTIEGVIPELPDANRITVAHLLQHASGLPDFLYLEPFTSTMARPWTSSELLALVAKEPLSFEPGSRCAYSNSGYLVLGLIAERLTGRPFAELLKTEVLTPLGLTDSRMGDDVSLVPYRAAGYTLDRSVAPPRLINPLRISLVPPGAAGGMLSRPAEMVLLARLDRLLSPATIARMQAPACPGFRIPSENGLPAVDAEYGLGIEHVTIKGSGRTLIGKNGSIPGFANWWLFDPTSGMALAASANNETALHALLAVLDDVATGRVSLP